jgi:hypothetical protein
MQISLSAKVKQGQQAINLLHFTGLMQKPMYFNEISVKVTTLLLRVCRY